MFPVLIDYATPSTFESERDRQLLGLTANARRPVKFHARVRRQAFPLRLALQALGELVWSDDSWMSAEEYQFSILDPVITVHPDRVFFEAFSQDQSAYGCVIVDRDLFEAEGDVATGTTNVDFTGWLWAALGEMRSRRTTWFRIEPAGFEVASVGAGGRFEAKVELPDHWVRGFLQLQAAMALPGTRIECRPVDILAPIRYLRYTKAKISPRALRYEFDPGQEVRLVVEPFEEVFRLKGTEHNYSEPRKTRTWGRRRLRLIEPLLPYADSVTVYLKGRALPSFYAVHMEGITFVLGLSGWSAMRWTGAGSFDLLVDDSGVSPEIISKTLELLRSEFVADEKTVIERLSVSAPIASQSLTALCRRGQAIFDVERHAIRHRELFETPIDEAKFYPPDPRRQAAEQLVSSGRVTVGRCEVRETTKMQKLKTPNGKVERQVVYRDWLVAGTTGELAADSTEIVVSNNGRIIFGKCACPFFAENLMNQGPCEHMLALFRASDSLRVEGASARRSE